ncbi:MAG TPA: PKD domain-containing protein [Bacteroidia bacterium]|nr:PKD domain-containing protein [Bacteroidia bacterium]
MQINYVEQSTAKKHFRKLSLFILSCIFCSLLFSGSYLNAQIFISNFNGQLFKTGFTEVEGLRFDKSGQIYVWEKGGKVWVVDTNGTKITTPILDISEEVGNWRDHGLNGFALDPDFETNGYFYLYYTVDRHYLMNYGTGSYNSLVNEYYNATIARVTRYTANSATNFTTVIPGSRLILVGENKKTGIPVLHESHSGGQLVFGSDGSLLISTGDGASYAFVDSGGGQSYWQQALTDTIMRNKENIGSFRSQLVDCLNGKILRVDPATGNGLPTNPYYDSSFPRAAKSRVWDLGLRNPFRMTLRPGTGVTDITAGDPGVLYIGDVGWDTWEDMNVSTGPDQNFGWPLFEGLTPAVGYTNVTTVVNKDAPNPLFGGSCTKQFFSFSDLLIQANLAPSFPNPCNASQQVSSATPHWVHTRPIIDWSHSQALTRTGTYNGNNASQISIGNAQSPIAGFDFIGNASVGGAWYEGTKYPFEFQNTYFHADYAQAWILNLKFHPDNTADSVKFFAANLGPVVDIEYNPKDEWLYYIKYPADIYKLVYTTSVNNPPVAIASQNVLYGGKPLQVNFTGNNSSDPENLPLTYSWNFGDGTPTSSFANPQHTFNPVTNNPIAFTVTLTVTDNIGQSDTTRLTVYVNDTPPQVNITSFTDGDLYTMSHYTNLPLQANVFDAESTDHFLSYTWQTFLHHNNHQHPEFADTNRITTTVITPIGCDGGITYYYRIQLTVTDPIGLSTTVEGNVYPSCDPPAPNFTANVTSVCAGQQVSFTDATTKFPDSWLWSFPGGNPSSSTLQNPTVTYSSSGTYNVSLTATNSRGSNSITKTGYILIYSKPQANISPSGTDSVCSKQPILLSANTGNNLTYQWLKSGINIAGATGATHNAVLGGNYKVRVTRSTTGCNTLSAGKLIVYRAITSTATPQGPVTFCAGDSVKISAGPGPSYTYHWRKNGAPIQGATSINYTAKTAGIYKVNVTEAHGCTKLSNGVTVTVNCREEDEAEFSASLNPNPVHSNAYIQITLPSKENISIHVFDALGRAVKSLVENREMNAGRNEINFDVSSFTPGIYFVKVAGNGDSKTLKLVVDKRN